MVFRLPSDFACARIAALGAGEMGTLLERKQMYKRRTGDVRRAPKEPAAPCARANG